MGIAREIYLNRDLIRELVARDLKLRYMRPALGFFWAFLSPLLVVAIFYLVFSVLLRVETKEAPFILYLMSGVFSWRFFQDSLMSSVSSLIDNKNLIRESSFPHYLIPLSIVLANGINFLPSLAILMITALCVLKGLPVFIIFLPIIFTIHLVMTTGMSMVVSIVYVKWRDTKYILEAALLVLFYLTPAVYSLYLVQDSFSAFWYKLYIYNPLVGILNLYRLATLKGFYPLIKETIGLAGLVITPMIFAVAILIYAFYFYKRNKSTINDYLAY